MLVVRSSSTLYLFFSAAFGKNELAGHFLICVKTWFGSLCCTRLVMVLGETWSIDSLAHWWIVASYSHTGLIKLLMRLPGGQKMVLCYSGCVVRQSHGVEPISILLVKCLLHHLGVSFGIWKSTHVRCRRKLIQIFGCVVLVLVSVGGWLVRSCNQARCWTKLLDALNHGGTFTSWTSRGHLVTIGYFFAHSLFDSLRLRCIILA